MTTVQDFRATAGGGAATAELAGTATPARTETSAASTGNRNISVVRTFRSPRPLVATNIAQNPLRARETTVANRWSQPERCDATAERPSDLSRPGVNSGSWRPFGPAVEPRLSRPSG